MYMATGRVCAGRQGQARAGKRWAKGKQRQAYITNIIHDISIFLALFPRCRLLAMASPIRPRIDWVGIHIGKKKR